jgi:hypothetical protein
MFKTGDIIRFEPYIEDAKDGEYLAPTHFLILNSRQWFRYKVLRLDDGKVMSLDKSYANKEGKKVA